MHGEEMKYMAEAYDTNLMSTAGAKVVIGGRDEKAAKVRFG